MLKVAVFDSGWGGDIVAQDIEDNLAIVEVIRIIDWRNAPYADKSRYTIRRLVETALKPYIGQVDVIVMASFEAQCAMRYLKTRFPYQKFIQMDWPCKDVLANNPRTMMILAGDRAKHSFEYRLWRRQFKKQRIIEPPCEHWTARIDENGISREFLRRELAPYKKKKIDTVVLGNTHFWDLKEQIEDILGWRTMVVDPRQILIDQLNTVLKLEGTSYLKSW